MEWNGEWRQMINASRCRYTINCYEDKCPKQISDINKAHKNWLQVVDGRYPWQRCDVQSLN